MESCLCGGGRGPLGWVGVGQDSPIVFQIDSRTDSGRWPWRELLMQWGALGFGDLPEPSPDRSRDVT